MSEGKCSALPWRFNRIHTAGSDTWYVVTDERGYGPIVEVGGKDVNGQIAQAKYLITDPLIIEANAALIVRAVNSHAALVGALKRAESALQGAWSKTPVRDVAETLAECRAALELAGE